MKIIIYIKYKKILEDIKAKSFDTIKNKLKNYEYSKTPRNNDESDNNENNYKINKRENRIADKKIKV